MTNRHHYYCFQCYDSNINSDCPLEACERRLKETGSLYKKEASSDGECARPSQLENGEAK